MFGWTINDNTLDTTTDTYSHEMVESMSDPSTPYAITYANDYALADLGAGTYSYYLQGTYNGTPYKIDVQSYYSKRDQHVPL